MSSAHSESTGATRSASAAAEPRRGFLKSVTVLLGALCGVLPLIPGLRVLFDPLRRRDAGATQTADMIRVTNVDAVPADGVPRQFPVLADQRDAWTFVPQQRVGSVFLRRSPDGETLQCFSSICPHAGCSVQYSPERESYVCPCHNSQFTLDGEMIPPTPSPRDLDPLEVTTTEDGAVLVKYVRYYPGKEERKVQS